MRPVDPRLLREAPAARRFLAAAAVLGLLAAASIVTQAVAVGRIVAELFLAHRSLAHVHGDLVALVAATAVRAAVAWTLESGGRVTALAVAAELRAKLLAHVLAARPGGVPELPAGELAVAAVTGLDALDPYFARYLPQLVLGAVVPVVILVRVGTIDILSAVIMALTVPLIPIFGILVGRSTQDRARASYSALATLSTHFLDVVRGLPTLRAYNRGRAQAKTLGTSSRFLFS